MASKDPMKYKLLSDEPIRENMRDHLQFKHVAGVLARAALYTEDPITIGIYGKWGSGKTSLMRLMRQIVNKEGQSDYPAIGVWFNAWQYEREDHLIIPLLATIARDLQKRYDLGGLSMEDTMEETDKKARQLTKKGAKSLHDALRSVLYGLSMKGKLGIPLLGEIEISSSMKNMIERYEAVTQDTLMARSLYFDAFDRLHDLAHDDNRPKPQIVVFVDDLDRCFPEQAVRLLESIKLVLHQPKFSFVLGIYPEIIEEFIRNKYAAQYPLAAVQAATGDDAQTFQSRMNKYLDYFNDYLGKIVQVKHQVPEREKQEMRDYVRHLLTTVGVIDQFKVDQVGDDDLLDLIAEVGNRRPREIVRKINSMIVNWRIAQSIAADDGTEDAPSYDLLAGLINEIIIERIARGSQGYKQFRYRINWLAGDEEADTYGRRMADALSQIDTRIQEERVTALHSRLQTAESATMKSLVDMLAKDEHFCNILHSPPGQRWLSQQKSHQETPPPAPGPLAPEPKKPLRGHHLDLRDVLPGFQPVEIKGGRFLMGDDKYATPEHEVTVADFVMGATPVTQAQYEAIIGENPSEFKGGADAPNRPVENVSWEDAQVFIEQLNRRVKGQGRFRLPSEAEWEYAAIGGHKAPTNDDGLHVREFEYAGSDNLDEVGWYDGNSKGTTHVVGQLKPNQLGLYDMSGNVWEWCQDKWHDNYNGAPDDGRAWEDKKGSDRVLRGGSWYDGGRSWRSAYRNRNSPDYRSNGIGCRLVFVP